MCCCGPGYPTYKEKVKRRPGGRQEGLFVCLSVLIDFSQSVRIAFTHLCVSRQNANDKSDSSLGSVSGFSPFFDTGGVGDRGRSPPAEWRFAGNLQLTNAFSKHHRTLVK